MTDHESGETPASDTRVRLDARRLMTPQATAVAGFAFAVFSMLGQGSWSMALSALFWGDNYAVGAVGHVMAVWGVGCLLTAALGAGLAYSTLRASAHGWESHLARATVLVAAAGGLLAVLTILGGLVHGR